MTDVELLKAYSNSRSVAAFEELIGRHIHWVRASALRQVREPSLADDVTQAVFIALAMQAPNLRADTRLTAWLFKVTRFASVKAIRSEARRKHHERKAAEMKHEASTTVPQADWQQISHRLDSQIARLRPRDRDIILLRFYQQKSFLEVAHSSGISEDAAKKRVERALMKLRQMLHRQTGCDLPSLALGAGFAANISSSAPDSVVAATIKALQSYLSGGSTDSNSFNLARGVQSMLKRRQFSLVFSFATIIVLLAAAGFVAVSAQTRSVRSPLSHNSAPTSAPATAPAGATTGTAYEDVIERTLVGNVSGDSTIDLDTGQLHAGPTQTIRSAQDMRDWMKATGVDAVAMVDIRPRGLIAFDMVAVPAPPDRWEISAADFDRSLKSAKPGQPTIMDGEGKLPKTFLFRTREGRKGVLQILSFDAKPAAMKIRYHLLTDASAAFP